MSTNPSNAIGTNGAYGGRTSVNAFNDVLGAFTSRGIISGWAASPDSGLDITIGGDGSTRDVAVAEDNIGNKTTINNISEDPVSVTIPAAPATNSRIDLVVAYVDNPAQGSSTETDNPAACGLIVVSGAAASTPSDPTDADIRTAITADGGAGTIAYYVILAKVKIASGTTDITSNMITQGANAGVGTNNIADGAITTEKIADGTINGADINWTSGPSGASYQSFSGTAQSSNTNFKSFNIQPGNYVIIAEALFDSNTSAGCGMDFYIRQGSASGTVIAQTGSFISNGDAINLCVVGYVKLSAATNIYITGTASGTAGVSGHAMAFRIF